MYSQNERLISNLKAYAQALIDVLDDMARGESQTAACAAHGMDLRAFRHLLYKPMPQLQGRTDADFAVFLDPYERLWLDVFKLSANSVTDMPPDLPALFRIAFEMAGLDKRDTDILMAMYQDERSTRDIGRDFSVTGARVSQLHTRAMKKLRKKEIRLVLRYGTEYVDQCRAIRREWAENSKKRSDKNLQKLQATLEQAAKENDVKGLRVLRDRIDCDIAGIESDPVNRTSVFDLGLSDRLARELSCHEIRTRLDIYFASPTQFRFLDDALRAELDRFLSDDGICDVPDEELREITQPRLDAHVPMDGLGLSVRAMNALNQNDIKFLSDLRGWTDGDLLSLRNIGAGTAQEIIRAAAEHGVVIPSGPQTDRTRYGARFRRRH